MEKAVAHTKSHIGERSRIESRAIYAALISGSVGFVVGLLSFHGMSVSLFERGISLGFVGSILGGVVGLVTYLIFMGKWGKQHKGQSAWSYAKGQIGNWSIGLVHGLLAFLGYALLFYIMSQAFQDAMIDMWSASAILALSTGFVAYVVAISASNLNASNISMLAALFLVTGVLISMLTANDPHWWYLHFSSLGAGGGVSGYAFNGTLIIAGLVIVALSLYVIEDFKKLQHDERIPQKAKVGILQVCLTGIGIALACVGAFVYNVNPLIHNYSAGGMALLFLTIIALLPLITPGFARSFFVASYALAGSLFLAIWLISIGYFNLTVFELAAAAIVFIWLVVFVRHVTAMVQDNAKAGAV